MVLTCKDILQKKFLALNAKTSAAEAARLMKSSHHGFVVATDESSTPIGIVTEWDYLAKVVAEGQDAHKLTLQDLMSTALVYVSAEDGLDSAAQVMSEKRVRRLLVMSNGRVIGVVTERDLLGRLHEYVDTISSQIARLQTVGL